MPRPKVLGHRGYSARFPENTRLAFVKAIEMGADGVECDVQKTSDGHYVILHDADLDRTSNGIGRVDGHTLAEIQALDFGSGEKVITLGEMLALIPVDRYLNIELKKETVGPQDAEHLSTLILKIRNPENTMISSFEHRLLPPFRRAGFETGMLIGDEHSGAKPWELLGWAIRYLPTYINLPVQAFERVPARLLKVLISAYRVLGRKICFWTVNTDEHWGWIQGLADIVITDEVEKIKARI